MIRESSVQFLIKGNDLEQVFDTRDFIRPHGVGIVHDDFELAVHFCVGTEKRPVFLCDIVSGYGSGPLRLRPFIFCNESFDIGNAGGAADRNRLFAADFESVPFCGVVRSCNHDAGICSELAVCVIGHRCRAHAQVNDIGALFGNAFGESIEEGEGMRAHVSADNNFFCFQEHNDSSADSLGNILVQLLRIDATDIVGL